MKKRLKTARAKLSVKLNLRLEIGDYFNPISLILQLFGAYSSKAIYRPGRPSALPHPRAGTICARTARIGSRLA